MTYRRTAATAALLGAIALAGAPLATAAPTPAPKPGDPNLSRSIPGTSCTVGQLKVALDKQSPGLSAKLEQAAGGPKQFADIATSDPATRQFKLASAAFVGSAAGFGIFSEQQNIQNALSSAYKSCSAPAKK
ncbi:hemophore-related protein [Tsukamurella pseudospumae]|uniref:Hemophore-related protein n=1 Tax=Tsukamurella pseudospumae TaxID=239498 RepID=A0A138AVA1_9ACTN|nr:hemophore-related protein [Tsukamurella pseudospumae]KXO91345.1 hypothetical protein AXK61_07285 [Tsukamurella pseudospumae]KXP14370.1 hypothetical protein AXK60_00160 [Tsukamurella pseudospumae]